MHAGHRTSTLRLALCKVGALASSIGFHPPKQLGRLDRGNSPVPKGKKEPSDKEDLRTRNSTFISLSANERD
jgi:hypothetical protein